MRISSALSPNFINWLFFELITIEMIKLEIHKLWLRFASVFIAEGDGEGMFCHTLWREREEKAAGGKGEERGGRSGRRWGRSGRRGGREGRWGGKGRFVQILGLNFAVLARFVISSAIYEKQRENALHGGWGTQIAHEARSCQFVLHRFVARMTS